MRFVIWAALALLMAGLGYWLLVLTEGVYLGPRVVRLLYDWGAKSYDEVKEFDMAEDAWRLAIPLERRLRGWRCPPVLDVATGTGRMLLAILRRPEFEGWLVGLDASLPMLRVAREKAQGYGGRASLVWKDASRLPFADGSFAAVTCIEGLEFMPHQRFALEEMARVLAPGGVLLLSNRVGRDTLFFPGRTFERGELKGLLASLSMEDVHTNRWQDCYDLVWAKKRGSPGEEPPQNLLEVLLCPYCGSSLARRSEAMDCLNCDHLYPFVDGVLSLEV